jgi:hypothetical protein
MSKIFLHIGLHKTATTTLQRNVFSKIPRSNINYNPFELMPIIEDAMILQDFSDLCDKKKSIYKKMLDKNLKKFDGQTIFLSNENLSQNLFKYNWEERLELIYYFFPNASIIIFTRDEVSWLRSAYLQALHSGFICSYSEFLSFQKLPKNLQNKNLFSSVDFKKVNHKQLIERYKKSFGDSNIYLFKYEDFQANPNKIISKIYEILTLKNIDVTFTNIKANKAYTKKCVHLVLKISKFLKKIHLHVLVEAGNRQMMYRKKRALHTLSKYEKVYKYNDLFFEYVTYSRISLLNNKVYKILVWYLNRLHVKFVSLNPIRFFLTRYVNTGEKWFENDDVNKKLREYLRK